jgi:hypothetical protein
MLAQKPSGFTDVEALGPFIELVEINADRKVTDFDCVSLHVEQRVPPCCRGAAAGLQFAHTLNEIPAIPQRLEPELIVCQHRVQDLLMPGHAAKEIKGWERRVQEERQRQGNFQLPQVLADEKQLIIVNPNEITGLDCGCNDLGKAAIDSGVGIPRAQVEFTEPQQVVKQRPDRLIGEPSVVPLLFLR